MRVTTRRPSSRSSRLPSFWTSFGSSTAALPVPRAGLNRAVIAAAAADLADEIGWQEITLAAVAARFGVRQPSLYKHVAGLAELRRDVSVLAGRELHAELTHAAVGRSGSDALHAMADAYRTYAKKHPGRYAASVIAPAAGDAERAQPADGVDLVVTDEVVAVQHGLDRDENAARDLLVLGVAGGRSDDAGGVAPGV